MRSISIRLTALLGLFLLPCPSAFASAEEAKKVFDSLFAAKVKAVSATIDRADDIALGKEMLAIAKTSENQPDLLVLLCDQVHDLCIRHADGFATAVEAQQFLADKVETKRAGAQDKLATLLTRQMATGKADEREGAGESLIALLISMGDEKFEKKQYAEAAGDYRRAVTVATQRKAASLEEAKAKLEFAAARDRAVKNLSRLQEKLLKDANDFATAEEIVKLYVIELDEPAGAVPYLNRVKDEQLKKMVSLATKPMDGLDEEDCLRLGEWYHGLVRVNAGAADTTALGRAEKLLARFLELHTADDLKRIKITATLKEIRERVGPTPSTPTRTADGQEWTNLLKIIDTASDAINGGWTLKDGVLTLTQPARHSRLEVPVAPEGSYHYQAVISISASGVGPMVLLTTPGSDGQFAILLDNAGSEHHSGLSLVKDLTPEEHLTRKLLVSFALTPNKKYLLDVVVKNKSGAAAIIAKINGKELFSWEGSASKLSSNQNQRLKDSRTIGFYGWTQSVVFHEARIKMLDGNLRLLRESQK